MRTATLFCLLWLCLNIARSPTHAYTMPLDPVAACALRALPDARRDCIGVASRPCLEADGGETTPGAVACYNREREMWELLRDAISDNLRDTESPSQGALLDAALAENRRWAAARCAYAASIYEGGSLSRVVGAACRRDAVAEFTLELMVRKDER